MNEIYQLKIILINNIYLLRRVTVSEITCHIDRLATGSMPVDGSVNT